MDHQMPNRKILSPVLEALQGIHTGGGVLKALCVTKIV